MGLLDLLGLKGQATALALGAALGVAAQSTIGGAVHEVWRVTPWSAESRMQKAQDRILDLTGQLNAAQQAVRDRDAAITERDQQIRDNAAEAAASYSQAAGRWGAQCVSAFQSGVAAGRAAAQKGPSDATTPPPGGGQPAVGGLRPSFRDVWASGAFHPAPASAAGGVPRGDVRRH